ncbi:unnamed protein product [Acanthosepion pharaonis]|uniref:Uncharacterized protein n=1 Tax=Acanthosepion pharaonis TaxID=158019 RepID=A0A812DUV9_ACAPH|nr:unnamed protein product [Sepia pharaonis]
MVLPNVFLGCFCLYQEFDSSDQRTNGSPNRFSRLLCVYTKNSTVRINALVLPYDSSPNRFLALMVLPTVFLVCLCLYQEFDSSDQRTNGSPNRFSRLLCVYTKNSTLRINALMVLLTVFLGCSVSIARVRQFGSTHYCFSQPFVSVALCLYQEFDSSDQRTVLMVFLPTVSDQRTVFLALCLYQEFDSSDQRTNGSPNRFSRLLWVYAKNSTVRINALMVLPTVFLGCFVSIPRIRQFGSTH